MQGKQSLSDPLESSVDQQTRVILCVPIFRDRQVIGVVGGSYNVTKLGNMLFDDLSVIKRKSKPTLRIKDQILS